MLEMIQSLELWQKMLVAWIGFNIWLVVYMWIRNA